MNNEQSLNEAKQLLEQFGKDFVPMIGFCQAELVQIDEKCCEIVLPLTSHTKNHLGSMYFGALHVGADCAAGMMAMRSIQRSGYNISLVFKNSQANFFKRPDGDVHFLCTGGLESAHLVEKAQSSDERQECALKVEATVPAKYGNEVVAQFQLTLSLKKVSN